jgi:hypothetical protein
MTKIAGSGSGSISQRRGSGSGSTPKCHGSTTLVLINICRREGTATAATVQARFIVQIFMGLGHSSVVLPKWQCWGSVIFWCGSESIQIRGYIPLTYGSGSNAFLQMQKNIFYYLPAGTLSSVLKFNFLLKYCVKFYFASIISDPLNTF